jgi:predicted RNA-binding Zn-ribbon protein involved in translation (DUF1610 family)
MDGFAQAQKGKMMNDLISRQAAISAICNACGKIDCDKMDKCEKLQLPPANCSEFPNNSDTISRQAAIDALNEQIEQCDKALNSFDISLKDEYAVKVERASLVAFRETLEYLPPTKPKMGKWNKLDMDTLNCNKCGATFVINQGSEKMHFCPNCGAKMEVTT